MKYIIPILISIALLLILYSGKKENIKMTDQYNQLTPEEQRVIINKGTEAPFTGKYENFKENGVYICRQCGNMLYRSEDKFDSGCGWPAFDDEINGAVQRSTDPDGRRTEITCANCGGHLGHVFEGENLTKKNIRHCVNSISMDFIPAENIKRAYFAGGCFWGVEYYMEKLNGVLEVYSGYMGGHIKNPTYKQVCTGTTGHFEAVEVLYDDRKIDFETIAREFFEIHDPTQADGQGPDIGQQYESVVFYNNETEKNITEKLIGMLESKGYETVTQVLKVSEFWKAEDYHQDYYEHKGTTPYCHGKIKRF
ncbi:MAG TPA: bifunctional methionine sulfoxide reductase B/A protein [Clostridiales bacterium]|nr:bifunctional methionine sulfoxide reductase B/A protein [Clostridiales bacterium]